MISQRSGFVPTRVLALHGTENDPEFAACKCKRKFGKRAKTFGQCGPNRAHGWIKRMCCQASTSAQRVGVIKRPEATIAAGEGADRLVQVGLTIIWPEHV